MKQLEIAPSWYQENLYYEALKHRDLLDSEFIQKINDQYLYWDKVKYQKTTPPVKPEILWTMVKISRKINASQIKLGPYEFFYNSTDAIQRGLHLFDLNIGGTLESNSLVPEAEKKKHLISSIMEEAIASSQIEGAVTTRKQAKEILRKNSKPRNKSEQMIVNNYQTIRHIMEIKEKPLTAEALFDLHTLISSQTLDDPEDEGRYRINNEINAVDSLNGEIVHSPPHFEKVPELMNSFFLFFNKNDDRKFIHPIIKGCIIHFMIGFIHPFADGNGRTARALFYWYLIKNGYWLTEYLSISKIILKSKNQYAMAFLYTEQDENDLTYFINYKIKTMQLAFNELKGYIQKKINEKKRLSDFHKITGINERQAQILKWVDDEPDILFSIKEIEILFNISNQTARTDLFGLQKRGFLTGIRLNKKTKAFHKSDRFDQLLSGN